MIRQTTDAITDHKAPVLKALKSINLAFKIFSYFPQPIAQIIMRSMNRTGL